MLEAKELVCVENWKWGTSSSKKVGTKDCQEIEELRRRCCDESDPSSTSKIRWIVRDANRGIPQTVSQLLAQMRESQDKVNSLSDVREFHDPETAGSSGASHVTSPPLTNPSYRTVLRPRFWIAAPETLNMMGISDVFWTTICLEKDNLKISRKITEFGIFFSWSETKTYRTYDDNRIEEETWATRLVQFEKHSPLWRWSFTWYWWSLISRWYDGVPEISNLGAASCKIPWLHGIWKLESQFQDWSLCEDSESSNHDVMDHRSWRESKVNWRIEYIAINSWREQISKIVKMLDVMIASALKKILNSHIQFLKRICVEEQRAQKYDRFLRGKTRIRTWSVSIFMHPELMNRYKGLSHLFTIRLQNDDVQDFRCQMVSGTIISRWTTYG